MDWRLWVRKRQCLDCGFLSYLAGDGFGSSYSTRTAENNVRGWGPRDREAPYPECYVRAFDLPAEFDREAATTKSHHDLNPALGLAWNYTVNRRRRCRSYILWTPELDLKEHLARHDQITRHRATILAGLAGTAGGVVLGWLLAQVG